RQTPDRIREHPLLRCADLFPFEEVDGSGHPGPWQLLGQGRGSRDANRWQLDQAWLARRTVGALDEARAPEDRPGNESRAGESTRSRRVKGTHAGRRYPIRCPPASAQGWLGYPEALSWPRTARVTRSCPDSITRVTGMSWPRGGQVAGRERIARESRSGGRGTGMRPPPPHSRRKTRRRSPSSPSSAPTPQGAPPPPPGRSRRPAPPSHPPWRPPD